MRFLVIGLFLFGLVTPAFGEKRVALVIGNAAYHNASPLVNTLNDASDMSDKLAALGFDVITGKDLSMDTLRDTIRKFVKKLDDTDVAILFYAGHGLQINGVNYIVPIDATLLAEVDVAFEAISLEMILQQMERSSKVSLLFLDACRDNPLAKNLSRSMGTRSASIGRGLARLGSGVGTLISFATQPGNVALDGNGRNSPFTTALLKHLGTEGQDIMRDLLMVRRDVLDATDGKQVPWDNSSLTDIIILKQGNGSPPPIADEMSKDTAFWDSIKSESDPAFFEQYLTRFPKGEFSAVARLKIQHAPKLPSAKASEQSSDSEIAGAVDVPKQAKVASIRDGFVDPTAEHPFDGYWELTRTAAKVGGKSLCGWPSLETNLEIIKGKIDHPEWQGSVDGNGNLQIVHYFIDDSNGKKGRNRLFGKLTDSTGSGKFSQIGGGCKGIIKLVRQ